MKYALITLLTPSFAFVKNSISGSVYLGLTIGISFFLLTSSLSAFSQTNYQKLNLTETSNQKPTLLIFSGSDWCIPCIKFKQNVLNTKIFRDFSKEHLRVEVADFPQHKILSKEVVKHNEALAEKYNPNGYFPHVVLVGVEGNVISQITTHKVDANMVISQIRRNLPAKNLKEFNVSAFLMGSTFQISIITAQEKGEAYLAESIAEITKIEQWLSSWKEGSITYLLNQEASIRAVPVSKEYYQLVKRCLALSHLTQGAFDISFGGLLELYIFDKKEHTLPNPSQVDKLMHGVGYQSIELLDSQKIAFNNPLTKISFGAIGKGYAADKVRQLMQAKGVKAGVINASGDLTTWGKRANGDLWNVGIPDPLKKDNILFWLPLENKAIATSGDYEKYFTNNGVRYSHIINPKTGQPVVGVKSVSIISDSAEFSDALATAISVLGLNVGMDLVNQLDGVECVFIDSTNSLHFSNGLQTYAP